MEFRNGLSRAMQRARRIAEREWKSIVVVVVAVAYLSTLPLESREIVTSLLIELLGAVFIALFISERIHEVHGVKQERELPLKEYIEHIKNSESLVRILDTWTYLTSKHRDKFKAALKEVISENESIQVQVLLVKPSSSAAITRARELKPRGIDVIDEIDKCMYEMITIKKEIQSELRREKGPDKAHELVKKIDVRMYDAKPRITEYRWDDQVYWGSYPKGKRADKSKQISCRVDNDFPGEAYSERFDELWTLGAPEVIPLEDYEKWYRNCRLWRGWNKTETLSGEMRVYLDDQTRRFVDMITKALTYKAVIEAGCADGRYLMEEIVKMSLAYYGIDFVQEAVDNAENKLQRLRGSNNVEEARVIAGDICDLPSLVESYKLPQTDVLVAFPFNSFGILSCRRKELLKAIASQGYDVLIFTYQLTVDANASRAEYYRMCGFTEVIFEEDDDGILFRSAEGLRSKGLRSYAYTPEKMREWLTSAGYQEDCIKLFEFGAIGQAFHASHSAELLQRVYKNSTE